MSPLPSNEAPLNPVEPAAFVCPCCGGREAGDAGVYALPPRRDPEGGLIDMRYPLSACARCGHVSAFPMPTALDIGRYYSGQAFWKSHGVDVDAAGVDWPVKVTENAGLWERYQRAGRQLAFIRRNVDLPVDARIIDLGSGYSPFLQHCRRAGFRALHALEPSETICRYLREHGVTAYAQLLEDFVERDDLPTFDLMVISHTVEHLLDPVRVITGLRRHLADHGVLYVDVPFQDHLRPYHQGLHVQFFNAGSMAMLADRAGFVSEVIEHDRFGKLDGALIKLLYAVYGRFFGGKGGVTPRPAIEWAHRLFWRPLKALFGLKINIFISSMDLRAVLIRRT